MLAAFLFPSPIILYIILIYAYLVMSMGHTLVRLEGAQELIVERLTKLGVFKNKSEVIRAGTRWRAAPYLGHTWRWVRARVGLVVGDYFLPERDDVGHVLVLPQASLGIGTETFRLEGGLLDSPTALASSADGGLGILSVRAAIGVGPEQRLLLGVGAAQDEGYVSGMFSTAVGPELSLAVGGFRAEQSSGAFVMLGTRLR